MYGQTSVNLSLKATVLIASVNNDISQLKYLNDNRYATSAKYWSSYQEDGPTGQEVYIEMHFAQQSVINEVRAYWAVDGDEMALPTKAYIAWWDGEEWQHGPTLQTTDESLLSTTPVSLSAQRIRLYIIGEQACGLRELQYWGYTDPTADYKWPAYNPTLDYDFRWEYPTLDAPTKGRLPEHMNVARERHGEWWSVAVGPNANPAITDTSMVLLVKKMDEDFAFF